MNLYKKYKLLGDLDESSLKRIIPMWLKKNNALLNLKPKDDSWYAAIKINGTIYTHSGENNEDCNAVCIQLIEKLEKELYETEQTLH